MSKQDKPRLAEVLGVEVGEMLRIVGGDFDTVEFCIQGDGEPKCSGQTSPIKMVMEIFVLLFLYLLL